MRGFLDKIRKPTFIPNTKLYCILILIVGIVLGVISKVLDETASNLLPNFLEILDLRNFFSRIGFWLFSGVCISIYSKTPLRAAFNVFLFFIGMVSSYYLYTVLIAGFYPQTYMMIWIVMTVISPFMGMLCWYAKGTHIISISISILIFAMIARQCFSFGFWYFDIRYGLELLLLIVTVIILYKTPKQIFMVIGFGLLLFLILSPIYLFWGML
jgi:hypothetical protein